MSEELKGSFAAIKMPKEYLEFIKRNNKLAQKVGVLMLGLSDYLEKSKQIRGYLSKPEIFAKDIENGTEEELKGFLLAVLNNTDGAVIFKDITKEQGDKLVQKLGEKVEVVQTIMEVNETDNKEVTV